MSEARVDETAGEALRNLELLTTPLAMLALLLLRPFLIVWIGPTLAETCAPVGIILIVGFWFNCFSHVPYARLIGGGRPDLVVKLVVIQLPPYLALLYPVIEAGGVIGAALAWSLRSAAELLLFLLFVRKLRLLVPLVAPAMLVLTTAAIAFLAPAFSITVFILLLVLAGLSLARSWILLPGAGFADFTQLARQLRTR
jgi:O-antigen/teichoic acid export membrane protein